jgi:hypothetical protein
MIDALHAESWEPGGNDGVRQLIGNLSSVK